MKKLYFDPEIEVVKLSFEDIMVELNDSTGETFGGDGGSVDDDDLGGNI